jgi:hypothetical protein
MPWIKKDDYAGEKISPNDHEKIHKRLEAYAATRPWGATNKIHTRFRGKYCYVAHEEEDGFIAPLCRLCYCGKDLWSSAFFAYSTETYEPCMLPRGTMIGSLEEAFSICETYLI